MIKENKYESACHKSVCVRVCMWEWVDAIYIDKALFQQALSDLFTSVGSCRQSGVSNSF